MISCTEWLVVQCLVVDSVWLYTVLGCTQSQCLIVHSVWLYTLFGCTLFGFTECLVAQCLAVHIV